MAGLLERMVSWIRTNLGIDFDFALELNLTEQDLMADLEYGQDNVRTSPQAEEEVAKRRESERQEQEQDRREKERLEKERLENERLEQERIERDAQEQRETELAEEVARTEAKLSLAVQSLDPIAAAPLAQSVADLKLRAASLKPAADEATLESRIALAESLLSDIALKQTEVEQAEVAWNALIVRRDAVRVSVDAAANLLSGLTVGAFSAVEAELARVEKVYLDLAGASDPTVYEGILRSLESAAAPLLGDAQKAASDTADATAIAAVNDLDACNAEFIAVFGASPLQTELDTLRADRASANLLPDQGARKSAIEAVAVRAPLATQEGNSALLRFDACDDSLNKTNGLLGRLDPGVLPPLEARYSQLTLDLRNLGATPDVGTFDTQLAKVAAAASVLSTDVKIAAAVKVSAEDLADLDLIAAEFDTLGVPNPVRTLFDTRSAELTAAGIGGLSAADLAAEQLRIARLAQREATTARAIWARVEGFDQSAANAQSWYTGLDAAVADPLELTYQALVADRNDLATAVDLGDLDTQLSVLEAKVAAFYTASTRASAPDVSVNKLADLDTAAAKFDTIGTPNPARKAHDDLTARKGAAPVTFAGNADGLADELSAIALEAMTVAGTVDDLWARVEGFDQQAAYAQTWYTGLDAAVTDPLELTYQALVADRNDLATAFDLGDLDTQLSALEAKVAAFYTASKRASAPDVSVKQLADLDTAAAKFDTIGTPNPARKAHDDLTARKGAAPVTFAGNADGLADELSAIALEANGVANTAKDLWARVEGFDQLAANAQSWYTGLDAAVADPLKLTYQALVADRNDLATAVDLGDLDTQLSVLEAKVEAFYTASTRASAPDVSVKKLADLDATAAKFDKEGKPNPVRTAHDDLTARKAAAPATFAGNADGLADELFAIAFEAMNVANTADDLWSRRDNVGQFNHATKGWMDNLDTAVAAPFDVRFNALEVAIKALSAATDLQDYESKLALLEPLAAPLYNEVTAAVAPKACKEGLAGLDTIAGKFDKIAKPNPVRTEFETLTLANAAAASLSDKALSDEQLRIALAADAASNAWAKKLEIDKSLYALARPIAVLGDASNPLKAQSEAIKSKYAPACSTASGVDDLKAKFEALNADVEQLKSDLRVAQTAALDVAKTNTQIIATLAEARKAVDALDPGDSKDKFNAELTPMGQRRTDAMAETNAGVQKGLLFSLNADSLAFVERVRKAGFEAKLGQPGGLDGIKSLINGIGDTTADPAALAVCRAAVSVCFKLELDIPEGADFTRLPTLFKLLGQVPAAHVGHDLLTKLEYETDPEMDSSYYSPGKIVLNKVGEVDSAYTLNNQVDPSKDELVNYFNATTLHEIGHGVDAKRGIMRDNMSKAEFGGWIIESIDSVAEAMYEDGFQQFTAGTNAPTKDLLVAMVKGVLATGKVTKPTAAPAGWDAMVRQSAFAEGVDDCLRVRDDSKQPWDNPTPLASGRCYHEGYSGQWFSYLFAERGKGVSNYQWRAPAEWFADLYAYHHLTKKDVPACVRGFITA